LVVTASPFDDRGWKTMPRVYWARRLFPSRARVSVTRYPPAGAGLGVTARFVHPQWH
jgi:hypothetical protein